MKKTRKMGKKAGKESQERTGSNQLATAAKPTYTLSPDILRRIFTHTDRPALARAIRASRSAYIVGGPLLYHTMDLDLDATPNAFTGAEIETKHRATRRGGPAINSKRELLKHVVDLRLRTATANSIRRGVVTHTRPVELPNLRILRLECRPIHRNDDLFKCLEGGKRVKLIYKPISDRGVCRALDEPLRRFNKSKLCLDLTSLGSWRYMFNLLTGLEPRLNGRAVVFHVPFQVGCRTSFFELLLRLVAESCLVDASHFLLVPPRTSYALHPLTSTLDQIKDENLLRKFASTFWSIFNIAWPSRLATKEQRDRIRLLRADQYVETEDCEGEFTDEEMAYLKAQVAARKAVEADKGGEGSGTAPSEEAAE